MRRETIVVRSSQKIDRSVIDALVDKYLVIGNDAAGISDADLAIFLASSGSEADRWLKDVRPELLPVVVICADSSPLTAARLLQSGAEDYLVAPANRQELLARVSRALRRSAAHRKEPKLAMVVRCASGATRIVMNRDDYSLVINDSSLRLTECQFNLAAYLMARTGHWVRAEALQKDVLRTRAADRASNIRFHILRLRRVLGCHSGFLHGWQRRGYMWRVGACDSPHCARRG